MTWFFPVLIGAAAADSINPCAFSILFLSTTFLFSLGRDRKYILKAGTLYILGIAAVYMAIGVGLLKTLSLFNMPNAVAQIGAGILIVYSVVSIIGELFPSFPLKPKIPAKSHAILAQVISKGTMPMSLALGLLVGLFEFPCTGGPYLFVLSLIHGEATFWSGLLYLFVYNVVFVLPLVIILLVATNKTVLEKADALRRMKTKKGRIILDVILLITGIVLFVTL